MDLHPLQTPNAVLTDCLNGTFITYNGNEHVLQNDMGNFKLEKCKLKENYIPIGTASYGDILYIASYNPLDKKFELGSYPSPLQWNSSDSDDNKNYTSIISQAIANRMTQEQTDNEFFYSELSELSKDIVFDSEDLKLQPGDKYKIEEKLGAYPTIESVQYFILDDNNVKQDVKDIEINNDEFKPVSWQMPGYLGTTSSILTPYSHSLQLLSTSTYPESVTYKLRSVISVFDEKLLESERFNNFLENVILDIEIWIDGQHVNANNKIRFGDIANMGLKEFDSGGKYDTQWLYDKRQIICEFTLTVSYEGDNKLYDTKTIIVGGVNNTETVFYERPTEIKCTPILYQELDETVYGSSVIYVKYDNLKNSVTYTANGEDRNAVASSVFNWTYHPADLSEDANSKNSLTLNFDLFKSNEDVKVAVFFKQVSDLLSGTFTLPTRKNDSRVIADSEYCIINNVSEHVSLSDVKENDYLVVFFQFLENEDEELTLGKFEFQKAVARFVYVDTKNKFGSEGRADVIYSLQNTIDNALKDMHADNVKVDINANGNSSFSSEFTLTENITYSDFFTNNTVSSAKLIQKIEASKNSGSVTILKGTQTPNNNPGLPGFMGGVKIERVYSLDKSGNYTSGGYKDSVSVSIEHTITPTEMAKSYDFWDVRRVKNITYDDSFKRCWITRSGKAGFFYEYNWDAKYQLGSLFDAGEYYDNFRESDAYWKNVKDSNGETKFNIVEVQVGRSNGPWSRMFSDTSQKSYICVKDTGAGSSKTVCFLVAAIDTQPGFCFIQFDKSGNDTKGSIANNLKNLSYFDLDDDCDKDEKFIEKTLYNYDITKGNVDQNTLNSKYKVYEKLKYKEDSSQGVYNWIYNDSETSELNCNAYCDFDKNSKIQIINFKKGVVEGKLLTSSVSIKDLNSVFEAKRTELKNIWNTKYNYLKDTYIDSEDWQTYKNILDMNDHCYKGRLYINNSDASDLKTFAKACDVCTPRKLAHFNPNIYSTAYSAKFCFGLTDNNNIRTLFKYIPGYVEYLP